LAEVTAASYEDSAVLWNLAYDYQVATIADFTDVFTGQAVSVAGPRSAILSVAAIPPLVLEIADALIAADGAYELTLGSQALFTLSGRYLEALGAVDISAIGGGETLSATASNGEIRLVLPVATATTWALKVSEQTVADREVVASVRLLPDDAGPLVTLHTANDQHVDSIGLGSQHRTGVRSCNQVLHEKRS
jgi:hypothetical protein